MDRLHKAFAIASVTILFFIAYPLLALTLSANPHVFKDTLESREALDALALTVEAATTSTVILLALGVPLAYLLSRFDFRGKNFVEALIDLPLVIPHAVVGIMILVAFGPRTGIGEALRNIGVVLENSYWAIVAAFAFVSAPLLIDSAKDGFASIDPYLEGVARCMGAGASRVFMRISLPLASRSILTGALLAWARAMSEVGALLIIAYYPKTINVLIIEWFNTYGLKYAISLTLLLLPVSIAVFVVLRAMLGWGKR